MNSSKPFGAVSASTKKHFLSLIDTSKGPKACWLWKGHIGKRGYGNFKLTALNGYENKARNVYAHKLAYYLLTGLNPYGQIGHLHTCDVPICCNPKHIFIGTNQDNVDDCKRKRRHVYGSRCYFAKLKESDIKFIRKHYVSGKEKRGNKYNAPALAKRFNVSEAMISHIINRHSWKYVRGVCPYLDKKLTETDIINIRKRYAKRVPSQVGSVINIALAKEYKVSVSTICDIGNRRTWKHIA